MKISIIVPVFRSLSYIGDCLNSLEAQKDKDFEVILVSDHLADYAGLVKEAESRKDKLNIKVCELTEGNGVAAARNLGMSLATGDYIYFLDDDDYLNSNAVSVFTAGIEGRKFAGSDLTEEIDSADVFTGDEGDTNEGSEFGVEEETTGTQDESADEENDLLLAGADVISFKTKAVRVGRGTYFSNVKSKLERKAAAAEAAALAAEEAGDVVEAPKPAKEKKLSVSAQITNELTARMAAGETVAPYRELAALYLVRNRKKFARLSALNLLYKREFLEKNHITFDESYQFYSDIPFVMDVIEALETYQPCRIITYYKRSHNDPIQNPALSQVKSEERFDEFVRAYEQAKKIAEKGTVLSVYLNRHIVRYFMTTYVVCMKRKAEPAWMNERFKAMSKIISEIPEEELADYNRYYTRVLKATKKQDAKKVLKIVRNKLAFKKLKRVFKKKTVLCKSCYVHLFYKKPVKQNYVMFESFLGRSYSDSPKYVYEYLQKNYPGQYKCIWVLRDKNKDIPYDHVKVTRFSIRYAYYLAVSKFFVFNMRQPVFMKVKHDQVFCETWHGIPIKRIMFDQEEVTGPDKKYKETAYKQSRLWNYLVSPNHYCTDVFKSCFLFDEQHIIETGYPRNDILHENDPAFVKMIKERIGIPEGKKAILYAPTFRDNEFYALGEYKYTCALDFNYLKEKLGDEYVLLMRTHYLIADAIDTTGLEDFVINVCNYEDIAELYLVSDMMISDYSSVAFDFANLRRPMIYYTYDLEDYRDNLRGFYIDIEKELPGPLVYTTEEVAESIQNIDKIKEQYEGRYDAFYEKYCHLEDGHSTERVVKQVFGK